MWSMIYGFLLMGVSLSDVAAKVYPMPLKNDKTDSRKSIRSKRQFGNQQHFGENSGFGFNSQENGFNNDIFFDDDNMFRDFVRSSDPRQSQNGGFQNRPRENQNTRFPSGTRQNQNNGPWQNQNQNNGPWSNQNQNNGPWQNQNQNNGPWSNQNQNNRPWQNHNHNHGFQDNFDTSNERDFSNENWPDPNGFGFSTSPKSIGVPVPGMGTTRSACEDRCLTTTQYNPVCGDNDVTYNNIERYNCAVRCGKNVKIKAHRACPRLLPKDPPPPDYF